MYTLYSSCIIMKKYDISRGLRVVWAGTPVDNFYDQGQHAIHHQTTSTSSLA